MKLLTKNSIYFLVITLIVFCIGGFVFYYQLQSIINEEATEELYHKKEQVISFISQQHKLPESLSKEGGMLFYPCDKTTDERLIDTLIYIRSEDESLPSKQLHFVTAVGDQKYMVILNKAMFEADDLIETIINSFIIIVIVLIVVLLITNYLYSKIAWKPFMKLLGSISKYDMEKHKVLELVKTNTSEFNQLSVAIHKMTERIYSDFENLKSFTENASHELQTPLAIINTKTEQLLQSSNLLVEEQKQVYEINQTAKRLSKLNQTLLLFAKIENDQFRTDDKIDFSKIVESKLEQFEDLIAMKHIKLSITIKKGVKVKIHPMLVEVLVSNLLSNAIKYVEEKAEIGIELSDKGLIVSNTGKPFPIGSDKLFERFFKLDQGSESTGLGLSLVKQIALLNEHTVSYQYLNDKHCFKYMF